jgi:hypothetical protein
MDYSLINIQSNLHTNLNVGFYDCSQHFRKIYNLIGATFTSTKV